jgi:hypothetical protein
MKSIICRGSNSILMLLLISMALLCGCHTTKQAQLEKAAKDWCATIRASQVLPVYPLTEDIQPGDVFLVQLPIDQQQKIYAEKGYLPLDNHLDRLNPTNYANFYSHNFLNHSHTNVILPADWMRPDGSLANTWMDAPNAAFPTYSFSVQRGQGINMAFPVEGVPVGLSLLGSDAADGTVIIKNAHTLGVDTISLYRQLKAWAAANGDFLSYFGNSNKPNYLRVVTRIYTVGYADVSLRDTSSRSGGLDAGAAKAVNLLAPQLMQGTNADSATVRSNFVAGSSILQELMTNALAAKDAAGNLLPGGSLRLTAASGRTISMREIFNPPLTIGYVGFDCVIERGGQPGPPIPAFGVLNNQFSLADRFGNTPSAMIYSGVIESSIYQIAVQESATNSEAMKVKEQMDALSQFIPPNPRRYTYDAESKTLHEADLTINTAGYPAFRQYLGNRTISLGELNKALAQRDLRYATQCEGSNAASVKVDDALRGRLTATRDALSRLPPEEQQAISDASSALVTYLMQELNQ